MNMGIKKKKKLFKESQNEIKRDRSYNTLEKQKIQTTIPTTNRKQTQDAALHTRGTQWHDSVRTHMARAQEREPQSGSFFFD